MDHRHVPVVCLPSREHMLCLMPASKGSFEHRLLKNLTVADFIKLKLSVKGIFMSSVDQQLQGDTGLFVCALYNCDMVQEV